MYHDARSAERQMCTGVKDENWKLRVSFYIHPDKEKRW